MNNKIRFGIIGYGYWGKNIARNIHKNINTELSIVVDSNIESLNEAKKLYKKTECIEDLHLLLTNENIDVVGIFTPPSTHFKIAMDCLRAKKNILVTKPLCLKVDESIEIKKLAIKNNLEVFIDDTFLFSGPIEYLKSYFNSSTFGDLMFVQSTRINLGLIQKDCNVIWDLAPHDVGILNYLLEDMPNVVRATGFNPFDKIYEHDCHSSCELIYGDNLHASLTLSWLSSIKTRRMIFGGTKETVVYDHLDQDAQIKIFKQSITSKDIDTNVQFEYSIGETVVPEISQEEPLKKEIDCIVNTLQNKSYFPANIDHAIKTVKTIEALQQSLSLKGEFVGI